MESIECYSDEELYEGIQEIVSSSVVGACLAPSDKPQAILLGGQSGAGKTTLHNVFRNAMNGNVIVVNGDEYRSFHPRYKQICAQYGIDSPAHTAAWAGRMVEAIIDALSIMGYNLIIEGTLRTSEVPLKTARLLRDRGYSVSLALMAGMFDDIGLYSRSEQRLFSSADDEEPASEALERILFGAWTAEESAHYEYLKQRLEQAKALK